MGWGVILTFLNRVKTFGLPLDCPAALMRWSMK